MKREIKYRGKHIDTNEWIYGNLIGTDVIVGDIVDWDDEYFCTEFWYKVDPETVGQYTGMKDNKGAEIYEGDKVNMTVPDEEYVIQGNGYMDVGVEKGFTSEGTVRFLYNCWMIDEGDKKGCPLDWGGEKALEVIGNIYEVEG